MKRLQLLFIAAILSLSLFAQTKKSVQALNISTPLAIDGILDEPVYKLATPAKDFVQLQPRNGKPAMQPTEAYYFYDNRPYTWVLCSTTVHLTVFSII